MLPARAACDHLRQRLVDARVHAQRQSVAGRVDLLEQLGELVARVAQHVQHRAEDLALQLGDAVDLDHRRRDEGAARLSPHRRRRRARHGGPLARIAAMWRSTCPAPRRRSPGRHRSRASAGRRRAVRASRPRASRSAGRRRRPARTAGAAPSSAGRRCRRPTRRRRPRPARRAPTSRRSSRSGRRSRRSAARRPCGRQALAQRALQQPRDLGRAGEEHALHARIGDERGADVSPRPGSSCSAPRGTPAACSARTAAAATSGVCSAGLASTTLPAASAAATWPVKIASGKFHGLMHTTGPSGSCVALSKSRRTCGGVVAQEVDRLAHLGDGVGAGLAGLAHEQRRSALRCRLRAGRRRLRAARRARRARSRPRRRRACAAPASAASHVLAAVASRTLPTTSPRSAGLCSGCVAPGPAGRGIGAKQSARPASAGRRRRRSARDSDRQRALRPPGPARASWRAPRRTGRAAARSPDAARRAAVLRRQRQHGVHRVFDQLGQRQFSSAMRFTNEELAPFSSRRRTR